MTKTLYAHIEKAAQNDLEVKTPSIKELNAIRKDHREKKKAGEPCDAFALYDAGGYHVQAKLLADILQLIDDAKIFVKSQTKKYCELVYISGTNGAACLCPVRRI